jgi:hypothetical protein
MECPNCNGIALDNMTSEGERDMTIDRTCEDCGFKFTLYLKLDKWEKGHHHESEYEIEFDN